jgi:hypothetical protein
MSKSFILISFFCILFLHSAKAKNSTENTVLTVTISNYNLQDIYATTVRINAVEVYDALKIPFGSPIKAIIASTKVEVPAILSTFENKQFIQLYLSMKANQSIDIQFFPSKALTISEISSFQWDQQNHQGFLSNGVIKLRYNDDKWDLIFETAVNGTNTSEKERTVLQDGAYYGWMDSISRGRVSDTRSFTPKPGFEPYDAGPDGKGMISTRKAKITSSQVIKYKNGNIELLITKQLQGYSRNIDILESYTLISGSSVLKYALKFVNKGAYPVYVGYVGRGGFLNTRYGNALKTPNLETAKVKNIKSESIRIAWVPQPVWFGLSSDNGVGVFVSSLQKYPAEIMRGSMVWAIRPDGFELPLVEHTQGHYPFTINPGSVIETGLYISAFSGGIPVIQISKSMLPVIVENKEIDICTPVSVFYNNSFKNFASVSDFANLKTNSNIHKAGLILDFNKSYLLDIQVSGLEKGREVIYELISAKNPNVCIPVARFSNPGKQTIDLNKITKWKGIHSFVLQKNINSSVKSVDSIMLSLKPFAPVELISPFDKSEITDISTFYRWIVSPEAQGYELQMSDNIDMSNGKSVIIKNGGINYHIPKELPTNGIHYWRVRAVSEKLKGEWSEIYSFETNTKHTVMTVRRVISTENPLFTIEAPSSGIDIGKMVNAIPMDLRSGFAIVVNGKDKNELIKLLDTSKKSGISILLRSHHPSPVKEWQSLANIEKAFREYPNVIGVQGGEALGSWYGNNEQATYMRRLIVLCGKYGKIIHEADGCYDENKWLEIFRDTLTARLINQYKANIIFSQKNNIFNRQFLTQSALFGIYLTDAVQNTGAWEDGGWYWAQVGFKKLGQSTGARTGELHDMPPIFWNLTFLMGIARGATVLSMDGQGGVYMRGHYDPTNPKHRNQVLWSSEGEATETFTRFVIPFLRAVVKHQMFVTKPEVLKNVKLAVTYDGVDEVKNFKEDRYREFWSLFKGTYGFSKQGNSTGEVYEFFPNTGRYFFIPVLPPAAVNLNDNIRKLPVRDLQDPNKVKQIFDEYYSETYKGSALVYQVGDMLAVMNTHENDDITDNYNIILNRGIFKSIVGNIQIHSYLMGKFENRNKQLWLQVNTNYAERNTGFTLTCSKKPKVSFLPENAAERCEWNEKTKMLDIELNHKSGVVELIVKE